MCDVEGCKAAFVRKSHLQRHQQCVHSGEPVKAHICPVEECGKSFSLSHQLKRHAKVHEKESATTSPPSPPKPTEFRCQACEGVVYRLEKNLKQHQNLEHSGQTFVCGVTDCTFTTLKWSLLKAHKLESHPVVKRSLVEARDSVEDEAKSFKCTVDGCQKTFSRKSAVAVHVKTVHQDLRPFECRLCQSKFGHKHLLNRHLQRIHAEE